MNNEIKHFHRQPPMDREEQQDGSDFRDEPKQLMEFVFLATSYFQIDEGSQRTIMSGISAVQKLEQSQNALAKLCL